MYGLIWRILPGPWASKLIMAAGLLAGAAALLWFFAFPAISPHMPFNDGAVEIEGTEAGGSAEEAETGEEETNEESEEAVIPGAEGEPEGES